MANTILRSVYLRNKAVWYLQQWLGIFYQWGGDDPSGWDCSGLIIEVLQSVGIFPHNSDDTANGLYLKFKDKKVDKGYAGCLVFWFASSGKASHIEMMIDSDHVIGASGGYSGTKSREQAIKHNAFVKMRPIGYRGDNYKICDPFKDVK